MGGANLIIRSNILNQSPKKKEKYISQQNANIYQSKDILHVWYNDNIEIFYLKKKIEVGFFFLKSEKVGLRLMEINRV